MSNDRSVTNRLPDPWRYEPNEDAEVQHKDGVGGTTTNVGCELVCLSIGLFVLALFVATWR
jgi:hypothetical protein